MDVGDLINAMKGIHDKEDTRPLAVWWWKQANSEIDATVAKATEYSGGSGGSDLAFLGRMLAWGDITTAQAMELGCWAYIFGKLGRVQTALMDHRFPSNDTLFDLNIYGRMIQRIREVGGWPDSATTK
jgi:hypothetical protein